MDIGDAELEDMVAEFDLDRDGMINEDEFLVGPHRLGIGLREDLRAMNQYLDVKR